MGTKKNKSSVRSYSPVRVVNPRAEWYTARVHPCQSLIIKLRKPSTFIPECSENARFKVVLYSNFLIQDKAETDKDGDWVYTFNQKYNLSDWVKHSQIALGEIGISLVDNEKESKFHSNVCVIQNGN